MASNTMESEPSNFDRLSVRELKGFLLINRAKGVEKISTRTLKEVETEDYRQYQQRQQELFKTPLGEIIPEPWTLNSDWNSDVTKIPSFRTQDVYYYLVLSASRTFDFEQMNAKKQLKAKVFYEDGHVHSVKYHDSCAKCSHCYVKASVIPSLPTDTKKKDYTTWVCLSKISGNVHAAGCNCVAGEGESCNHVAALLYALVDITDKRTDGLTSATSVKCKWNQPRKRKLSPRKSQSLVFKKLKFDECDPKQAVKSDISTCSKAVKREATELE